MFILNKYRKKITYFVLIPYLFLVSLTIFHYHHVDIQNGDYKFENEFSGRNSNPLDSRDDLTHECMVQQFASTIINYSFTGVFNFVQEYGTQDYSFFKITSLQTKPLYNSNQHRAPPILL